MSSYKVKLEQFEGPLDLLLFFVKRDELNIRDIPIAKITNEFLEYIHYIQLLDLDIASDFIVMAATLMQIKAKMLLPLEVIDGEIEDPRTNLVKQLLEYKRYKEASEDLSFLEDERRKIFLRGNFSQDKYEHIVEVDDGLKNVTLFHLITALKNVLDKVPKKNIHTIERLNVSIDEQMSYVKNYFKEKKIGSFLELISTMKEKIRIVVTVLALLELVKSKKMKFYISQDSIDITFEMIEDISLTQNFSYN